MLSAGCCDPLPPTVAMVRDPSAAMPTVKPPEPMARTQIGIWGVPAIEPLIVAS